MSLFNQASLVVTPNGYKAGKLYSIKPTSGAGDLDVVRATGATRVNASGLIETVANNVPRLDYPPLGGCPSILVEPQSTNLLLRSQEFDNAYWLKSAAGTGAAPVVTSNAGISPDGTMNADRVVMNLNGGTSAGDISYIQSPPITSSVENNRSIFLKSFDGNNYTLFFGGTAPPSSVVGIEVTADWQRFDLNHVPSGTTTNIVCGLRNATGVIVSDTADILYWQAQLEQGTTATSIIPTVGSAVTRNADVISKTGVSDLIGQTEGSVYCEFLISKTTKTNQDVIMLSDDSNSNRILLNLNDNLIRVIISNPLFASIIENTENFILEKNKVLIIYTLSDFKFFVNGVKVKELTYTTPATSYSLNKLNLGSRWSNTNFLDDKIEKAVILPTAITEAEAIQLTTL
jgi:hypothetical protein